MERSKGQKVYRIAMLIIITIIITSILTAFATYKFINGLGENSRTSSINKLVYTISKFRSELEKGYLGKINDEDLVEGAIKGYVAALNDPYTVYYTRKEMEEIIQQTSGNYIGIGIYMTVDKEKNVIYVVNPIEESPAEKAGIKAGDIIKKVDGEEYTGEQMDDLSKKIKGEEGTTVTLEIQRGKETKEIEITRGKVVLSHMTAETLDDNIGYIAISDFDGGCAEEFSKKYQQLVEKGIKKLIIDVRNNGGGVVDEAIAIADKMTEKGATLLITLDKNNKEEITKSKEGQTITMPVVIITNEATASAAEILAASLKDNGRVTLVGKTTFGKGVIQVLHQFSDGAGLKMTINEYLTPKRNKINEKGIKPDIDADIGEKKDGQLERAIKEIKKLK